MPRLFVNGTAPLARPMALTDLDILNFALGLEHLESALYRYAIGLGLLNGRILQLFQQFGQDEATHVQAIIQTIQKLGGTPVQAQNTYYAPKFNTAGDVVSFFQAVEEVGASAYLGAARYIQNKDILIAAVSIHNVEGQHAAVLADFAGVSPSPVIAMPRTVDEVSKLVAPLLSQMPSSGPNTGEGGAADDEGGDYRTLSALE